MTGKDLIKLYQDVNHHVGENTKQLTRLKKPIKEALSSINPELGKDFDLANELWSRYSKISNRLKPNMKTDIVEGIMTASKGLSVIFGIVTGNPYGVASIGSAAVTSRLAKEMITNPRFQQLAGKTVDSLNAGKFNIAKKTIDAIAFEVKKIDPDLAKEIYDLGAEEMKEFFSTQDQATEK